MFPRFNTPNANKYQFKKRPHSFSMSDGAMLAAGLPSWMYPNSLPVRSIMTIRSDAGGFADGHERTVSIAEAAAK